MALTAAEKMRKYRERIKNNPVKYEIQRIKDLERIKAKKKKIAEMDNNQQKKQRQLWREQKQRQRNKIPKQQTGDVDTGENNTDDKNANPNHSQYDSNLKSKIRNYKKKCIGLNIKCKKTEFRLQKLSNAKETLRKRYYRLKVQSDEKISNLQATIDKMKAREEVLEATMRATYRNCVKNAERKVLKNLVKNAKNKTSVAKLLGVTERLRAAKSARKSCGSNKEITCFFVRDDVSRCTAGKKECRTKNKEKYQIRYLIDNLRNLYQKYRNEGGRFKFTTFYNHKPFYVLSPHLGSRNTCLCIKHSNIDLKFVALKINGVFPQKSIKDILTGLTCDLRSYSCMYGKCDICKKHKVQHSSDSEKLNQQVTWYQWERIDHEYLKRDGARTRTMTTKKTTKTLKKGTIKELLQKFESDMQPFKRHYFNVNHQQEQYQTGVNGLKEHEALVICDFSENYETKMSEEIQSMHFGASKSQVTLHTGMIYWTNKSQSFCTISPNQAHQPSAIWAHLAPILKLIKEESLTTVSVIHFYSDGPSSQYRQKNNFYLHSVFTKKLNLQYSTWSYFESGHGKGVADGIGGSVKRILDRQVCYGRDITSASDVYDILKEFCKATKVFYISDSEINAISSMLPQNLLTLKGTMQLHQVITNDMHTVNFRDVSCFCGPLRGLCTCYSPKIHYFETFLKTRNIPEIDELNIETLLEAQTFNPTPIESFQSVDEIERMESCEMDFDEPIDIYPDLLNFSTDRNNYTATENSSKSIGGLNIDIMPITFQDQSVDDIGNPEVVLPRCARIEDSHFSAAIENNCSPNLLKLDNKENHISISNYSATSKLRPINLAVSACKDDVTGNYNNMKSKEPKSLKHVPKRTFKCSVCHGGLTLNRNAKCMACKNWLCWDCSEGQSARDYICSTCLS